MRQRRPKTLIGLLVFFCWIDARSLGWLLFPSTSVSYHYYSALGYPWVHSVVEVLTVAFAATATGYLWRPREGWYQATLVTLAAFAVMSIAGSWHMLNHVEVVRAAYRTSRAARGLPVPEERLAVMFTSSALLYTSLAAVAFFGLLAFLAWRRRAYVAPDDQIPSTG